MKRNFTIEEIVNLIRENLKRRNSLLAEPKMILKEEEYIIIEERSDKE